MKIQPLKKLIISVLIIVLSAISFTAFSQGGIKLEYKYSSGQSLKYNTDTKIVQDMDVNGQSMLVNIARYMACEIKGAGKAGENVKIEVKMDTLSQNIESPQGSSGGNINEISGKSFNLIISPSGKIIDNTEGAKVVYTVEGSGESNMEQEFLNYFPVIPVKSIKPGDTWSTTDTINNKTANNTIWMPVESNFKFEGIEKIDGTDCAKITATLYGTRKMVTQSQGMEIHMSGQFTGTQTLFFNVKDGYFTKLMVSTKMTGNIEIPDQGMSFPVVMNTNSTSEIGKK